MTWHSSSHYICVGVCIYCLVALVQTGFHLSSQYLHLYQKYIPNIYILQFVQNVYLRRLLEAWFYNRLIYTIYNISSAGTHGLEPIHLALKLSCLFHGFRVQRYIVHPSSFPVVKLPGLQVTFLEDEFRQSIRVSTVKSPYWSPTLETWKRIQCVCIYIYTV